MMPRWVAALITFLMTCCAAAAGGTERSVSDPAGPLKIRRTRMQSAAPDDTRHPVIVKFEIVNESDTSVANIVFQVVIVDPAIATDDDQPRIVAGPFTMRSKVALDGANTMDFEIRLRDLPSDCTCRPLVRIVSSSIGR